MNLKSYHVKGSVSYAFPIIATNILYLLIQESWNKVVIPGEWNKGTITRMPKRGALVDCNNWRNITLISNASKIVAKIFIKRIRKPVN